MFEDYARFMNKNIVPQPTQLFGIHAQARYVQWMRDQQADDNRRDRKERGKVVRGVFTIEERNLKALMRSLRLPETDVLCECPDEFTVGFLKHKGVYRVVEGKRRELLQEAA